MTVLPDDNLIAHGRCHRRELQATAAAIHCHRQRESNASSAAAAAAAAATDKADKAANAPNNIPLIDTRCSPSRRRQSRTGRRLHWQRHKTMGKRLGLRSEVKMTSRGEVPKCSDRSTQYFVPGLQHASFVPKCRIVCMLKNVMRVDRSRQMEKSANQQARILHFDFGKSGTRYCTSLVALFSSYQRMYVPRCTPARVDVRFHISLSL